MAGGLLTADSPGLGAIFGQPRWGLFTLAGAPVLTVDSVDSVEYSRDYRISDYPQEQGAFASYNKVQTPYQAKLGFLIAQSRTAFLNTVEQALASLDLVTVITPEVTYPQANLVHYGYRREAHRGRTLIRVDVWVRQVRVLTSSSLPATAAAAGAGAAADAVTSGAGGTNPNNSINGAAGGAQSTNSAPSTQGGQVQAGNAQPSPSGGLQTPPDQTNTVPVPNAGSAAGAETPPTAPPGDAKFIFIAPGTFNQGGTSPFQLQPAQPDGPGSTFLVPAPSGIPALVGSENEIQ